MSVSKKYSVNKLWFEKIDIGEWARLCENTTNVLCIVCSFTINCDNKGFQSLTQHANLPKEKLLMLGSDGLNVNKKVSRIINSNIKSLRGKELVEIGSCNIYTVDNAFVKGMEHLGSDISDLDQKLRLVEQWNRIIYYFEKFIPQHRCELMKTPKYIRVHKVLNEPTVKAEIIFIINSAKIFQKLTLTFQCQKPLFHVLHSELHNFIIPITAGKVCKAEVLNTWNNSTSFFNNENLKSLDSIELPIEVSRILSLVPERSKLIFVNSVKSH
ncbi:hypothetical protein QTP88_022210 [Uroleucon formosanum]